MVFYASPGTEGTEATKIKQKLVESGNKFYQIENNSNPIMVTTIVYQYGQYSTETPGSFAERAFKKVASIRDRYHKEYEKKHQEEYAIKMKNQEVWEVSK
jgi:hypothetical protein